MKSGWTWALIASVASSVLLHAVWLWRPEPSRRVPGVKVLAGVRVRHVVDATQHLASIQLARPVAPAIEVTVRPIGAAPAPALIPEAQPVAPQQSDPTTPGARDTAFSAPLNPDDFTPSASLDQPPQSLSDIMIEWPDSGLAAQGQMYVVHLTLLIDEAGAVLEATPDDDPTVPALYMQLAREAFMQARFSPGLLGEQAVRARMRVEASLGEAPSSDIAPTQ